MRRREQPIGSARAATHGRLIPWEALWQRLFVQSTLPKFLLVGAIGYLIYQAALFLMYDSPLFLFLPEKETSADLLVFRHGDVRLLIATLVATELSIVGVFVGHNIWTFGQRETVRYPLWLRFAQFNAKALVSTLGILTVTVNILTVRFDVYHFIAVPIGVVLAFSWNWLWDSQIIWRRAKRRHGAS